MPPIQLCQKDGVRLLSLSKNTHLAAAQATNVNVGITVVQYTRVKPSECTWMDWPALSNLRRMLHYPCSLYGVQINLLTSTSNPPRPAALRWRSRTLGSAQMTCCPFRYWIMSRLCSVLKISSAFIAVISLSSCMQGRPLITKDKCLHIKLIPIYDVIKGF
jgi:hypothetical protein